MSTNLLFLGLAALLLVFGQFVVAPLRMYFSHKSRIQFYRRFDPTTEASLPELESLIAGTAATLASRGFEVVGHFVGAESVQLRFTLLNRTSQEDSAQLAEIRSAIRTVRWLEFDSTFADGSVLSTNNLTVPSGTFARLPGYMQLHFPEVRDPLDLYELHLAACRSYFSGLDKVKYGAQEILDKFLAETRMVFEHQVACGLMRRAQEPGVYAPTLKGAFVMVWKNVFPVVSIRRILSNSRMKKIHDSLADLVAAEGWQE